MAFKKLNFEIVKGTTEGITYTGARKRRQTVLIRVGKRQVSRQAFLLGMILVILQVVDAVFTYVGLSHQGVQVSGNGIVSKLMEAYGFFPALLISKICALLMIVLITYFAHRRRWIRPLVLMLCAAYLTLVILPWLNILK